ncbi:hypothetical protein [Streptomyces poonensis]|uniref:Uncharacterized protein n=1 Tax=Streptomyces poonensis TaxID=68255 RepID=A0A918UR95_9ACTN|nr:hypothetical protein [Streptomyces poonensis]GGZ29663.1 hypothetical protein GCM10010365_57540 [Streptomyces poonensis]
MMTAGAERLCFHPLTYLEQGDEVVVGRTDVDSYGAFPADGAALLRKLEAGMEPAVAALWYSTRYGVPVDIDDFVETLRALEFLAPSGAATGPAVRVRGRRLGRMMFSWPAWCCYAMLVAGALAVCLIDPRMVPRPGNLFFSRYAMAVQLVVFVSQPVFMLLHECGHVLAGRRLGLRTRLRISRRLYFVTFETVLDGLVVVPRRRRVLPVLAGMLVDVLGMSALTLVAWLSRAADGTVPLPGRICLALAFTAIPRIAAQFYLFLRTDLYHLAVVVLGGSDPHGTAREMLANRVNRWRGRHDLLTDESRWHPRDRALARWYTPMYVGGYVVMTVLLTTVVVPVAWRFTESAVRTVQGDAASAARLADAALVLVLVAVQLAAVVFGAWRAWRRRRAPTIRSKRKP